MLTLHEAQENMRKLVEQDYRNAEIRRVYERHLLNEAAPKMLEALEGFVHLYDAGTQFDEAALRKVVIGMRAAIAKAKGESESLETSEDKSE